MRDAYVIHGEKILYNDVEWIVGVVYFIPGNSDLYVQLKNGMISMNVKLSEIVNLIVSKI
jgi:hypothetical protein